MLLGLCGYSKSGKDTVADALLDYEKHAFADRLKVEVKRMLWVEGIRVNFSYPEEKELWRDMLVFWGRKRRELNKDYWIMQLLLSNPHLLDEDKDFVIPDVRYLNEMNWAHSHGGTVIYLSREGIGPANDEEERSIAEIMEAGVMIVSNNGTPEETAQKIRNLLSFKKS